MSNIAGKAYARVLRRSEAVPVHTVRVAITARTAVAIGSVATRRFDENIRSAG
jgi:hypothetical protein